LLETNSIWWDVLELFGIWAAAAATFYAARTALKISMQKDRLNLKVSLSQMLQVTPGSETPPMSFLQISVTNLGRRKAEITSIYWTLSKPSKYQYWQNTSDTRSSSLPTKLEDGDVATFMIDEDQPYGNWYGAFGKTIFAKKSFIRREIDLIFLKCWVSTTLGESFNAKAPRKLKLKIRDEWNSLTKADLEETT